MSVCQAALGNKNTIHSEIEVSRMMVFLFFSISFLQYKAADFSLLSRPGGLRFQRFCVRMIFWRVAYVYEPDNSFYLWLATLLPHHQ